MWIGNEKGVGAIPAVGIGNLVRGKRDVDIGVPGHRGGAGGFEDAAHFRKGTGPVAAQSLQTEGRQT